MVQVKNSPLPFEFKLEEDWDEQENRSFLHSPWGILAGSDFEGKNPVSYQVSSGTLVCKGPPQPCPAAGVLYIVSILLVKFSLNMEDDFFFDGCIVLLSVSFDLSLGSSQKHLPRSPSLLDAYGIINFCQMVWLHVFWCSYSVPLLSLNTITFV